MTKNKLFVLLLAPVFFSGCLGKNVPKWDGKFWHPDYKTQSIRRNQDTPPQVISTSDPRFSSGVWISYEDLNCLYQQLVLNCKKWKSDAPTCDKMENESITLYLNEYENSHP